MSDQTSNSFKDFTKKYSLSKTLRFELRSIGNTQQMLEENYVFQLDKDRQKAYQETKPYFDRLHRAFVQEALLDASINGLSEYFLLFKEYKKDKNQRKKLDTEKKKLRLQIVAYFNSKGEEWAMGKYSHLKIKKKDREILFEEQVFQILKALYGNELETILTDKETGESFSIFDGWKGFTGYFKKFFETRRNFYKDDGTATALATRIIDQNLDRFLDNSIIFQSIKEKLDPTEVAEVEEYFGLQSDDVFSVEFYNTCLLQDGIDTYNDFLGGKTLANGEKKKGINEIINKYRQDNKSEKLPFLKKLDKQILSVDRKEEFINEIETPEELLVLLRIFYNAAKNKVSTIKTLLTHFFDNTDKYDLKGIYLSKEALNTIAYKWTNETDIFNENLYFTLKEAKLISSSAKKNDGGYSFPDFITLEHIKRALEKVSTETRFWKGRYYEGNNPVLTDAESIWKQFLKVFRYEFLSHFERIATSENGEQATIGYYVFKEQFDDLLKNFTIDNDSKVIIKNFADEILHIYQMAKYFALEKKRAWIGDSYELDSDFYNNNDFGFKEKFYENAYEELVQPYNKIRNYLTRKPYSKDKWKLNFECSYLLNGWSSDFDTYSSLIIKKGKQYYLAIVNGTSLDKATRQRLLQNITFENKAQKLIYDFQKPDNKNVPRLFIRSKGDRFAPAVNDLELPVQSILEIYDNGYFKTENRTNPNFRTSLAKLIDYFKTGFSRHNSYKHFDFKWKSSAEYKDISEFYEDTIRSCYMLDWENINFDELLILNGENKLYLFKVYNKDFSEHTKGRPNLHSLYFRALFSKENLANNDGALFKLSGGGEIFFRPKTLQNELGYREDKKGKEVPKTKRYSEDKMFLHFPIELNYSRSKRQAFNTQINNFLANNPDINIIGVDRGEKHLAYYSIINQQGEMLEPSDSLNILNDVDYHQKLEQKAEDRKKAREDWQSVEGIKDLKKGYISQVVRKLADLAVKHNAIIVMEDLNMRFKQIRGGIEKSAYQQLEKALIEKLNFLVNKGEVDPTKAGHLLRAYQLTAPLETFKDMGNQTGIIFYTQASYTSKIDPLTGWRPNIYLKYSNADQTKRDILTFDNIVYNDKQNRFEFTYDIKHFSNAKEFPQKTKWTVCSNVERFKWDRKLNNNKGGYTHYVNLTEKLKALFEAFGIAYKHNIISQIDQMETKGNEKFFKEFVFYFSLICQIRNTQQNKEGNENDFIFSPVEPFFDSRKASQFGQHLPTNGDDNGSYNIARKGILILQKVTNFYHKNGTTEKLSWNDLFVSNTEWDDFVARTKSK